MVGVAVQQFDVQEVAANYEPAEVDSRAQEEHEIQEGQILSFRVEDARRHEKCQR